MWKPELLAPAKNLERLKVAITYGADAVYVGGQKYGLRARADNFTDYELTQAVAFAHAHGAKVYVTLNAFLHDEDFAGLETYCQFLESIGMDAVIVSDLGVVRTVQKSSTLDVHLSTQASCLNVYAAHLWKELGVKRLIVGRELGIAEAGKMRTEAGIDVEMFTHGAMCMAYSGHCTISNYTAGRDSNRGGCAQSCRFPYHFNPENSNPENNAVQIEDEGVTFMSSKDLWGVEQVQDFFKHRICSLKIEGRMKSSFYVATTCKAYRQLIDAYAEGALDAQLCDQILAALQAVPHRDYTSGSLSAPAERDSIYGHLSGINVGQYKYLGIVLDTTPQRIIMRLAEGLAVGDEIEIFSDQTASIPWTVNELFSAVGERVESMRQDNIVCLPRVGALTHVANLNVVRAAA